MTKASSGRRLALIAIGVLSAMVATAAVSVFAASAPASARAAPVTLTVSPGAVTVGDTLHFAGQVKRAPLGTKVILQEHRGTAWLLVGKAKTAKHGAFSVALAARSVGMHSFRAAARVRGRKLTSRIQWLQFAAPHPPPPPPPTPIDLLSLVSRATTGGPGDGDSSGSTISADGRYVAFTSAATNLVPGDTLGHLDVFLRDTVAGTTTLVSHTPTGSFANSDSYSPAISGNGRFVVFTSNATNVVGTAMPAGENAYEWDRTTGDVTKVCTCGPSNSASVADNGNTVFVVDQTHDAVVFASRGGNSNSPVTATVSDKDESQPRISEDGSTIVFKYDGTSLSSGASGFYDNVYLVQTAHLWDVRQLSTGPLSSSPDGDNVAPSVSADGRYVAYWTIAGNIASGLPPAGAQWEVVVTDTTTHVTTLVSRTPGGFAVTGTNLPPLSGGPAISADGGTVAYAVRASNVAPGLSGDDYDVVVQARTGTAARVVSRTLGGALGNNNSVAPAISGDGRYIAFHSQASNLVASDTDPTYDIYRWDALGNR